MIPMPVTETPQPKATKLVALVDAIGTVFNVCLVADLTDEADPEVIAKSMWSPPRGCRAIDIPPDSNVGIGWRHDGKRFIEPRPEVRETKAVPVVKDSDQMKVF